MDTVTINRAEYDSLVAAAEALEDLRAYDDARARIAAGDDELIPAEAVKRILAGESPVRVFRDLRGMTQAQLADAARVNRVQITDIESGKRVGSIATIRKLADALGVTIDDLV